MKQQLAVLQQQLLKHHQQQPSIQTISCNMSSMWDTRSYCQKIPGVQNHTWISAEKKKNQQQQ